MSNGTPAAVPSTIGSTGCEPLIAIEPIVANVPMAPSTTSLVGSQPFPAQAAINITNIQSTVSPGEHNGAEPSTLTTFTTQGVTKPDTQPDRPSIVSRKSDIGARQIDPGKRPPPPIVVKGAVKPGIVASRIQVFNVQETPKLHFRSGVSVGVSLPSKIAKPKSVKSEPLAAPTLEAGETPDPEGTISGPGRRQTQAFEAPAGRRTSHAYEHRHQLKTAQGPLYGKTCPHHKPGETILLTDKGIAARPRHHKPAGAASPWDYWIKVDEVGVLPAAHCDQCLIEAGLPPLHFQSKIGHAASLSKPSQCIDTTKARRTMSSEEQPRAIKGMSNPHVVSAKTMPLSSLRPSAIPRRTFSSVDISSWARQSMLADYEQIKFMLDEIILDHSRRLRGISLKLASELEKVSVIHFESFIDLLQSGADGSAAAAIATGACSASQAGLVMLDAISTLQDTTADSLSADVDAITNLAVKVDGLSQNAALGSVSTQAAHLVSLPSTPADQSGTSELPVVTAVVIRPPVAVASPDIVVPAAAPYAVAVAPQVGQAVEKAEASRAQIAPIAIELLQVMDATQVVKSVSILGDKGNSSARRMSM